MWIKKYVIISLLVLTACSTTEQSSDFDSTLYSGKPVESLTNVEPPKTEEEAISRGDIALSNKNVDLALYEYIRSLSFPNAVHKDKTLYTVGRIHLARENSELADKSFRAGRASNKERAAAESARRLSTVRVSRKFLPKTGARAVKIIPVTARATTTSKRVNPRIRTHVCRKLFLL